MIFFKTFVLLKKLFLTERQNIGQDTLGMPIPSDVVRVASCRRMAIMHDDAFRNYGDRPRWELLSPSPERTSAVNDQIPKAVIPGASTRAYTHTHSTYSDIYVHIREGIERLISSKFSVPPHLSISAICRLIEAWPFLTFSFLWLYCTSLLHAQALQLRWSLRSIYMVELWSPQRVRFHWYERRRGHIFDLLELSFFKMMVFRVLDS